MKTIQLIAPRIHSNYLGWISELENRNIETYFDFMFESPVAGNYSLRGLKVRESLLSKLVLRKLVPERSYVRVITFLPNLIWLKSRISEVRADLLILRDRTLLTRLAAFYYRRATGREPVLYVQETDPISRHPQTGGGKKLLSRLLESALPLPRLVTSSIWERGDLVAQSKSLPFLVARCSEGDRRPNLPASSDFVHVVSIGKYRRYKRFDVLLAALEALDGEARSRVSLEVAGAYEDQLDRDYFEWLNSELKALRLGHLQLWKNLNRSEVENLYHRSNLFVLSNPSEVASISVLEALNCGLQVASPDTNGTACYFSKDDILIFGEPYVDNLAQILRLFLSNTPLPASLQVRHLNEIANPEKFFAQIMHLWNLAREAEVPRPYFSTNARALKRQGKRDW